tara:strand:- start:790 stop:1149 length:360 start_codon:yes stop_codon:yes gene_type:complete
MNQYLMVWRGKLEKTNGGLKKRDLIKNKRGKIVSKRRHNLAKRRKTLMKLGYKTEKGVFKKFTKKTNKKGGRKPRARSAPNPLSFKYNAASRKVDRSAPQLQLNYFKKKSNKKSKNRSK